MTNLLPIETWRAMMGYHPYHFRRLANSDKVPLATFDPSLVCFLVQ